MIDEFLNMSDVPSEVTDAARLVSNYFNKQNIVKWELMDICSRNHADQNRVYQNYFEFKKANNMNRHIKSKILALNEPTYNGRFYSRELIESVIKKTLPEIEKKRFFVTHTEPESAKVIIGGVAGIINKLCIENNDLIADIEFIDTPNSLHAKISVEKGIRYVRMCGIGSIKMIDGVAHVQEDYEPLCCFLTYNPA